MLSGESLTGRRGAAALSRPATVSEPAQPAPTRAMNPPIDPPGGEIEEAPLPHHESSSGADVESGPGAPPKVPPPAKAWTMIVGAFVVLMFMLASVRTTLVGRVAPAIVSGGGTCRNL